MAEKLSRQIRSIPNKPISPNTLVLFPKGPSPVKGVFDLEFGALVNNPKTVVARYKILPKDSSRYADMVRDLKPCFGRYFSIIPGIKTMFAVPKSTDCLEYAVYIDSNKANSYFNSARAIDPKRKSAVSMDFIKSMMKTHIARFHKF